MNKHFKLHISYIPILSLIIFSFFITKSSYAQEKKQTCEYKGNYSAWANCFEAQHRKECYSGSKAGMSACVDMKLKYATQQLKNEFNKQIKEFGYYEELDNAIGLYNVFIKDYCGIENNVAFDNKNLNVKYIYECRSRLKLSLTDQLERFRKIVVENHTPDPKCSRTESADIFVSCIMNGTNYNNLEGCSHDENYDLDMCNTNFEKHSDNIAKLSKDLKMNIKAYMSRLRAHVKSDYIRSNIVEGIDRLEFLWGAYKSELCLYQFWSKNRIGQKECYVVIDYNRLKYLKSILGKR